MPKNQTLIEDMMTLGGSVFGNLVGARHEFRAHAKQRAEQLARQFDLVTRSEFDAAFAMLSKARMMQEELSERLDAIETRLGMSSMKSSKSKTKLNLPSVKKSARRKKHF